MPPRPNRCFALLIPSQEPSSSTQTPPLPAIPSAWPPCHLPSPRGAIHRQHIVRDREKRDATGQISRCHCGRSFHSFSTLFSLDWATWSVLLGPVIKSGSYVGEFYVAGPRNSCPLWPESLLQDSYNIRQTSAIFGSPNAENGSKNDYKVNIF